MDRVKRTSKKIGVGIVGGIIVLVGLVLVPYPGPGWLVVFVGLAVLATEFDWAQRVLDRARGVYDRWQQWLKNQKLPVKIIFWLLTFIVVTLTIWLINGYGLINDFFGWPYDWVRSPLPIFR